MSSPGFPEPTPDILDQIAVVRKSGLTNMITPSGVHTVAKYLELYELADFISDLSLGPRMDRASRWLRAIRLSAEREHRDGNLDPTSRIEL